jgi:hypothetical protein
MKQFLADQDSVILPEHDGSLAIVGHDLCAKAVRLHRSTHAYSNRRVLSRLVLMRGLE